MARIMIAVLIMKGCKVLALSQHFDQDPAGPGLDPLLMEVTYVPGEDGIIVRKEVCESYTWAQNRELLTVYIPIGEVKAKDVFYKLTPTTLCIGVKGSAPVLECELFSAVKPDDSLWEIEVVEGQRNVAAKLQKAKSQNWPSLLKAV